MKLDYAIGFSRIDELITYKEKQAMDLPSSRERVTKHTPSHVNERIALLTEASIEHYRKHPEKIPERLQSLDEEWDIERALETNASSLILAGIGLSLISRRFLIVPLAVSGFLLQHGLQGWCPPLPLLRRLGYRTQSEIEQERQALRSISDESQTVQ